MFDLFEKHFRNTRRSQVIFKYALFLFRVFPSRFQIQLLFNLIRVRTSQIYLVVPRIQQHTITFSTVRRADKQRALLLERQLNNKGTLDVIHITFICISKLTSEAGQNNRGKKRTEPRKPATKRGRRSNQEHKASSLKM